MDENINENIIGLNPFNGERPMKAMDDVLGEVILPRPYKQTFCKSFFQKYNQDYRVDPSLTSDVLGETKVGFEGFYPEGFGERTFIFDKLIYITPDASK